jgi:hypothetical protein
MKKVLILLVIATTMTSCFYDCVETTYLNGEFFSELTYAPDPDYGCLCQEISGTYANGDTYRIICTTD